MAYKALFLPLISYGILLWGGGYEAVLRRAQVFQNDALRAIFNRRRRDSVRDLYIEHNLATIEVLYKLRVALLAYKINRKNVPQDVSFSINPVTKRSDRRVTSFTLPLCRNESSRHTLAYRLPAMWGSLPAEVRSIKSAKMFLEAVKDYLR